MTQIVTVALYGLTGLIIVGVVATGIWRAFQPRRIRDIDYPELPAPSGSSLSGDERAAS